MDEAHARHGSSRFVRHAEDCACTPPTQVFVIESTTVEERVYDILKRKVDIRDSLL